VLSLDPLVGSRNPQSFSCAQSYNIYTAFFTDDVMPSLIENGRPRTRREMLKDWLIHMNNVRRHNSGRAQRYIEASRAERRPHPAHSPDLAPSDFFLFGCIKGKLSDYNCKNQENLLNAITQRSLESTKKCCQVSSNSG
jgi:hypothetical protein